MLLTGRQVYVVPELLQRSPELLLLRFGTPPASGVTRAAPRHSPGLRSYYCSASAFSRYPEFQSRTYQSVTGPISPSRELLLLLLLQRLGILPVSGVTTATPRHSSALRSYYCSASALPRSPELLLQRLGTPPLSGLITAAPRHSHALRS